MSDEKGFRTKLNPEKQIGGWKAHIKRIETLEKEVEELKEEVTTLRAECVTQEQLMELVDVATKRYKETLGIK